LSFNLTWMGLRFRSDASDRRLEDWRLPILCSILNRNDV
jgi:hypothetical protein